MNSAKNNLKQFFNPRHIAIVGVSTASKGLGGKGFLERYQKSGYQGRLYPINPNATEICGLKVYPDLSSLPEVPDMAMVSVPAKHVPSILEECARIGLRHIHILTAGFKETGTEEGKKLEEQIISISKEKGLLVIGPNGMGPYCPSIHLTAWGAIPGMSGPLGVIGQSGMMTQRLTEYACSLGVGVEKAVSIGNASILDSTDFLEFMAGDEKIRVIAMYLESVKEGSRFFRLVREINREKPIIIWKGGESQVGAMAAASHTGGLSGEQVLWDALYRQTGSIHVRSMEEWMDAVITFSLLPVPRGKGVFLVGGGGGNGVSYSDICINEGLDVPALSHDTMRFLRQTVPLAGANAGNPLDMPRIFLDAAYLAEVLELGYKDPSIDIIVVDRLIPRIAFHAPDMSDSTAETAQFVKSKKHPKPTVFTVDSGGGDPDLAATGATLKAILGKAGIPAYPSLSRAARALAHFCNYHARFG